MSWLLPWIQQDFMKLKNFLEARLFAIIYGVEFVTNNQMDFIEGGIFFKKLIGWLYKQDFKCGKSKNVYLRLVANKYFMLLGK